MRSFLMVIWLMLPAAVGAWHFGPGQGSLKMDDAADALAAARLASEAGNWASALTSYEAALAAVDPKSHTGLVQSIRLGKAQAQMFSGQLPEASADLESLVVEMEADPASDSRTRSEALSSLASAKFYMTWLKRLEGLSDADWQPDAENARQSYRRLAEEAEKSGDTAAALTHRENLEGTIRLARMDISELQGLAIPKQCQNCKSSQCKSRGRKPTAKPKDGRGAGMGPAPDGSGS